MNCLADQAQINYYTAAISVDNMHLSADEASLAYWQAKYIADGCNGGGAGARKSAEDLTEMKRRADAMKAAAIVGDAWVAALKGLIPE